MRRKRLLLAPLVAIGVLAACQTPAHEVSLAVRPVVQRQVLAVGYTAGDIHHLDIRLTRPGGALVAEAEVPGDRLGSTLSFGNLKANSAYTIAAVAYADAGETQVISDEATSRVELLVGLVPVVAPVTVPVKLKTQVEVIPGTNGEATLELRPGAWITPTPMPTPTPPTYYDPCDPSNPNYLWECL